MAEYNTWTLWNRRRLTRNGIEASARFVQYVIMDDRDYLMISYGNASSNWGTPKCYFHSDSISVIYVSGYRFGDVVFSETGMKSVCILAWVCGYSVN